LTGLPLQNFGIDCRVTFYTEKRLEDSRVRFVPQGNYPSDPTDKAVRRPSPGRPGNWGHPCFGHHIQLDFGAGQPMLAQVPSRLNQPGTLDKEGKFAKLCGKV
jgi:hypothetical protein